MRDGASERERREDPRNPWRTVSSRRVYENPWMAVREDQVIRPDGRPGIYGVVETRVATGVVALTPALEVVLVGQWRYPLDRYSWEIVEGGADPGEDPLEAARRELREEAGLEAARWSDLGGELHLSNCISSERGVLFLAEDLREVPAAPEGTEVLEVRRAPLPEVMDLLDRGELTDAVTVIALLRLERRLRAEGRWPGGA